MARIEPNVSRETPDWMYELDPQSSILQQLIEAERIYNVSRQAGQGVLRPEFGSAPADVTGTMAAPQITGPEIGAAPPEQIEGPAFEVAPDMVSVENPYFEDQTAEQQAEARSLMRWRGLEAVLVAGLEPERYPYGKVAGAVRGFVGGVSGFEHVPTPGESEALSGVARLAGEGVKYAALIRTLATFGLGGVAGETAAGAISAGARQAAAEDPSLESFAFETIGAGAGAGIFRGVGRQLKGKPTPKVEEPITLTPDPDAPVPEFVMEAGKFTRVDEAVKSPIPRRNVAPRAKALEAPKPPSGPSPEEVASQHGLKYDGMQEMPGGKPPIHQFTTEGGQGTTFYIKDLGKAAEKVAEVEKRMAPKLPSAKETSAEIPFPKTGRSIEDVLATAHKYGKETKQTAPRAEIEAQFGRKLTEGEWELVEDRMLRGTMGLKVEPSGGMAAEIVQGRVLSPSESISLGCFGYNPEIVASAQKAWSGVVDNTLKKGMSLVPKRIRDMIRYVTTGDAPPEAKELFKKAQRDIQTGRLQATEIGERIRVEVPEEFQFDAFKQLDPTAFGDPGDLPIEFRSVVNVARNKIDELGEEWANLELGGPNSRQIFERNVGEYMSRYYKSHDFPSEVKNILRGFRIKGRQAKRRILKTTAEREKAGLVTDPSFAASRTIADLTHDVETAKLFRRIASKEEWTADSWFPGASKSPVPNDPRYGVLAGKYVESGIYDELLGLVPRMYSRRSTNEFVTLYHKLLASWKFGKTALNPATHGRNIFSNMILADLGGLPFWRTDVYAKALKDYLGKSGFYREALDSGLLGTDWYGAEVGALSSGFKSGDTVIGKLWDAIGQTRAARITGKAGRIYQGEEHLFKLALYSHMRRQGVAEAEAVAHAQKYLFDYNDLSPFLKRARQNLFGGPFLAFTAKALPVIAESSIKHPIRFWKWVAGFKIMNEYSKSALGVDEAEYRRIKESLPEWQRSGWQVLMPFRDKKGRPILFDLTYNLPWGDIGEQGTVIETPVVGSIVDRFALSNPFLRVPAELAFNKDLFKKTEIYERGVRASEGIIGGDESLPSAIPGVSQKRAKQAEHVVRQAAPGILTAVPEVVKALTGEKKKSGEKRDVVVTLLNKLAGLKFSSVNVERGLEIKQSQLRKEIKNLTKRIVTLKLDKSGKPREKQIKVIRDEIDRIVDEHRRLQVLKEGTSDESATPPDTTLDWMKNLGAQ